MEGVQARKINVSIATREDTVRMSAALVEGVEVEGEGPEAEAHLTTEGDIRKIIILFL